MIYFNIIQEVVKFFTQRGRKKDLIILFVFAVFIALIEGLSAIVLIPFLNDLAGSNNDILSSFANLYGLENVSNLEIIYYCLLVLFFIIKGVVLFAYIKFTNNFMFKELHHFNKDMTLKSLNLSYIEFKNIKFSEITRLIVSDSSQYFINFLKEMFIKFKLK